MGDFNIMEIVGNLFFPIAAYVMLFWYTVSQRKEHAEETKSLSEAIQNNTVVMQQLADRIERLGK